MGEILAKKFSFSGEAAVQIQKGKRVPNKMDKNRSTTRHVGIKMSKKHRKRDFLKEQERRLFNIANCRNYKVRQ